MKIKAQLEAYTVQDALNDDKKARALLHEALRSDNSKMMNEQIRLQNEELKLKIETMQKMLGQNNEVLPFKLINDLKNNNGDDDDEEDKY